MTIKKYLMEVEDQKYFTVQFEEKLKSLSDEYKFAITDANFEYIKNSLGSLSEILYSPERETNPKIHSVLLKVATLSDLISKSAEEFESLDILKVLLECYTDIFKDGKSVKIETLEDDTLRISAADS
jgi:hypothetical protein